MNEQTVVELDYEAYKRWYMRQIIKTAWLFRRDEPVEQVGEKRNGQVFIRQGRNGAWIPSRLVLVNGRSE